MRPIRIWVLLIVALAVPRSLLADDSEASPFIGASDPRHPDANSVLVSVVVQNRDGTPDHYLEAIAEEYLGHSFNHVSHCIDVSDIRARIDQLMLATGFGPSWQRGEPVTTLPDDISFTELKRAVSRTSSCLGVAGQARSLSFLYVTLDRQAGDSAPPSARHGAVATIYTVSDESGQNGGWTTQTSTLRIEGDWPLVVRATLARLLSGSNYPPKLLLRKLSGRVGNPIAIDLTRTSDPEGDPVALDVVVVPAHLCSVDSEGDAETTGGRIGTIIGDGYCGPEDITWSPDSRTAYVSPALAGKYTLAARAQDGRGGNAVAVRAFHVRPHGVGQTLFAAGAGSGGGDGELSYHFRLHSSGDIRLALIEGFVGPSLQYGQPGLLLGAKYTILWSPSLARGVNRIPETPSGDIPTGRLVWIMFRSLYVESGAAMNTHFGASGSIEIGGAFGLGRIRYMSDDFIDKIPAIYLRAGVIFPGIEVSDEGVPVAGSPRLRFGLGW